MAEKSLLRKVGDEQAGIVARRRRQALRELAAFGPRQVDHHRLLALVQPFPVEARSIRRLRPAMPIGAAADRIDADHLGAHLRQMQPAGRPGNERRRLDHPQALENVVQLPLQSSPQWSSGSQLALMVSLSNHEGAWHLSPVACLEANCRLAAARRSLAPSWFDKLTMRATEASLKRQRCRPS